MNERTIRRPKGPAIFFSYQAITYFLTVLSTITMTLMPQIFDKTEDISPLGMIRTLLFGIANLFMSVTLFSKKYNNTLLIATGALLIPSIFGLFSNITPYSIIDIIFGLLLIAFTYIMVKMPETSLRKKTVKLRFFFPLFQFVYIMISTIQSIQILRENVTETMGAPLDSAMNNATILIPSVASAISGLLIALCYVLLANWLADPYEK